MNLLIDIGNTRVKWTVETGTGLGVMRAKPYAGWDEQEVLRELLADLSKPDRVFIANVGGEKIGALIANSIARKWGLSAVFLQSSARAGRVRNAYQIPEQLGVDRWLSMIGGFNLVEGAVCVAGFGTAATMDAIAIDGQHLGGVIVPGKTLAIDSLLRNTSEIATRAKAGGVAQSLFADSTASAVEQGVINMLAALTERMVFDMNARLGALPTLLVTGGASSQVVPALRVPFREISDLGLRGLAIAARELADGG